MGRILTDLSFEDWVRHLFDHPVAEPAWYWDMEADSADLKPEQVIDYSTQLFRRAGELFSQYSDAQINQGLWFLVSESTSSLYALTNPAIALTARVECILSMAKIFEQCFVSRCTPHLSHLDEPHTGVFNAICYMWWDTFPLCAEPEDALRREIDEACISVMETTLQLPSIACQESALHGLGHWGLSYESRCQSVISAFLKQHGGARPELLTYAARAREGYIQ